MTYAPGMQFGMLLPFGVLGSLLAMGLTALEVRRLGVEGFEGYPLRLALCCCRGCTSLLVMVGHWLWPKSDEHSRHHLVGGPMLSLVLMPRLGAGYRPAPASDGTFPGDG